MPENDIVESTEIILAISGCSVVQSNFKKCFILFKFIVN